MKKLLILFAVIGMFFFLTIPAQSAPMGGTITFNEPGIGMGDLIDTGYASIGINWIGTYANRILTGQDLDPQFYSDGQILQYNTKNPAEGVIQLDFFSDYLTFDFRRPQNPSVIHVAFYDSSWGIDPFFESSFTWRSGDWETFEYTGGSGNFDKIVMYCDNKFVIDNVTINAVPIPAPLLLLASGLLLITGLRFKKS